MNDKEELLKKEIVISGLEVKISKNGTPMTKITDEKGLKYNLFHTKKDGTESKAYQGYKQLPWGGIGIMCQVVYKESEFTNEHGTFTSRGVVMLKPVEVKE